MITKAKINVELKIKIDSHKILFLDFSHFNNQQTLRSRESSNK